MIAGEVTCMVCRSPVPVQIQPQPNLVNLEFVSMVVLQHSGQTTCPKCGAVVKPVIAAVGGLGLAAAQVAPQEQNLVVPATANGAGPKQ